MYGWYRRRAAGRGEPGLDGYGRGPDADQSAVITALRQIQAADRQVVVLHYLVGEPVEQIAREVGIPAGTVRARLTRGRRGDSRHRAETLRVIAAVLVLAVIGGTALALSAGPAPDHPGRLGRLLAGRASGASAHEVRKSSRTGARTPGFTLCV